MSMNQGYAVPHIRATFSLKILSNEFSMCLAELFTNCTKMGSGITSAHRVLSWAVAQSSADVSLCCIKCLRQLY